MNRHRDVGTPRGDARGMPASVPEVARSLRRARTRQGLRLEDVSARTGLPLDQLQAIETGTVERIPDRVAILRTLRRYADHLGLPGDRFVLVAVEHWPTTAGQPTAIVAVPPAAGVAAAGPVARHVDTGVVPAAAPALATRVAPPGWTPGTTGRAPPTAAGPVAATGPTARGGTSQVPAAPMVDTGVVPTYQPPTAAHARRSSRATGRPRTPLGLRILVGVAGVAVVAGVAGLLVDHVEPHWLQDLGITHRPRTPATPADSSGTSTTAGTTGTTTQPTFTVASTTPSSATLAVRAASFTVQLSAVNGVSWVQATAAGKAAPTYAGVLSAGATQILSVQHSLVVQVGSVAAHIAVSVGGRTVGTYVPTAAPFTVTVQSVP